MVLVGPTHQPRLHPSAFERLLPRVGVIGAIGPHHRLIAPENIRSAVDAPSDAGTSLEVDRAQMENVLQLNAWMERYSPTVQPS